MEPWLAYFAEQQSGVIARRQALTAGGSPHELRRLLRRRELAPIHPGVYVTHTGEPTWLQKAWAAVLATSRIDNEGQVSGAALSRSSALHIERRTQPTWNEAIYICIAEDRNLTAPCGVVLHHRRSLGQLVRNNARPPRIDFDNSVIDVASLASRTDAVGILAQAVGERRTTPSRLRKTLDARERVRQRSWIKDVLVDIDRGSYSVLEREFLYTVLRPHALPLPDQQKRELTPLGVAFRDADYGKLIIELDGRAHHTSFDRRRSDLDRDLLTFASGRYTLRLGWSQIVDTPCRTAEALAQALQRAAQPCGPRCSLAVTNSRIRAAR